MEYSKIISVSGMPGLYELVSSKNDGAIVRSLDDKTTKFVSSRVHNFSHLESIEIYTVRDNVNLVEIFKAMEGGKGSLPDVKDNAAITKYFKTTYPDLDFDRVYASDMKKMIKWFEVLQTNKIEIKLSEIPEETEEAEEETEEETVKPKKAAAKKKEEETEEAPKKKAAAKPKKEEKEEADEEPAEKPKKKAASKKKDDDAEEAPKKKKAAAKKK